MKGKVYLVGAGPGDYKLMTLKGLECIKKADVIIYDFLVNTNYLKSAKKDCELIYAGKCANQHTLTQREINKLIVEKAQEQKVVVRLKGGDPYVYGRGGEEGELLYSLNIPFEVVPGVTSAIGGLCYAGIPITHRDYASSFHVITGHTREDGNTTENINWQALAQLEGTLVFLMGIKNLQQITDNLIKEGKSKDTPVAIIRWATRPNQQVFTTTLSDAYGMAKSQNIQSPALVVVGSVVNLRSKLNFFEQQSLFGKTVLVTRARNQNSEMVEEINDLGGYAIEAPMIKIEKILNNTNLINEIKNLHKYNYLILTSANSVDIFFETLTELKLDSRALSHLKVCAIGTKTAKHLIKYGIQADIVPTVHRLESLVEELQLILKPSDCILVPKALKSRSTLKDGLNNICCLREIPVYKTVIDTSERTSILRLLEDNSIDYVTFTSASTVINFIELLGKENLHKLKNVKLLSIGPITTQAMVSNQLFPHKEAKYATIEKLLEILIQDSDSGEYER